jgi:hypothetical protein
LQIVREGFAEFENWLALADASLDTLRLHSQLPDREYEELAISLDGRRIVMGSIPGEPGAFFGDGFPGGHAPRRQGSVGLWWLDLPDGELQRIRGPRVLKMAFRDAGSRILTLGDQLVQWDLEGGQPSDVFPLGAFKRLLPAMDAPRVLLTGLGQQQVLDLGSRELILEPRGAGSAVANFAFFQSGATLATLDSDWILRTWSWPKGVLQEVRPIWPTMMDLGCQAFLELGWGRSGAGTFRDFRAAGFPGLLDGHLSGHTSTDLWDVDPAGPRLLMVTLLGQVRLLVGRDLRPLWEYPLPGSEVLLARLDIERKAAWIYSESDGRLVRLALSDGTEEAAWVLPRPTASHHPAARVELHLDRGGVVLLLRGAAYALDPRGGRFAVQQEPDAGYVQLALSEDQRLLGRLAPGGKIDCLDLKTGKILLEVEAENSLVARLALAPGGEELVYSQGVSLRVVSLATRSG